MMKMNSTDPKTLGPQATLDFLTRAIAPRPIALVSTISKSGHVNLAPFSFFNAFGSNPPVVAFSPSRRARDGSLKDTYQNLMETKECVIHIVTFSMVEKMNITSGEYAPDVNEFEKSGFTMLPSIKVAPPRVKESPVHMECTLLQMIHLGDQPGSGNLAICEVVWIHQSEVYCDAQGRLDPTKLDHVARNGADYYTRAIPSAMFELKKP